MSENSQRIVTYVLFSNTCWGWEDKVFLRMTSTHLSLRVSGVTYPGRWTDNVSGNARHLIWDCLVNSGEEIKTLAVTWNQPLKKKEVWEDASEIWLSDWMCSDPCTSSQIHQPPLTPDCEPSKTSAGEHMCKELSNTQKGTNRWEQLHEQISSGQIHPPS